MEKKFIQSMLFSTAILVVYSLVSPPLSLSAQGTPQFDESARVRKGTISEMDPNGQGFVFYFNDGDSVAVIIDASTTVSSSNGEETQFSFLRDGSSIYVFGQYDKEKHSIQAEKIVMRNRPIMERTTLSRAEIEAMKAAKLAEPNLTVK